MFSYLYSDEPYYSANGAPHFRIFRSEEEAKSYMISFIKGRAKYYYDQPSNNPKILEFMGTWFKPELNAKSIETIMSEWESKMKALVPSYTVLIHKIEKMILSDAE